MRPKKYILAKDGKTPIPCEDVYQWAHWYETNDRHVADDEVGSMRVSTVFLGLDHNFFPHLGTCPMLWETMIFGAVGELESYQESYSSYDAALEGHKKAVELARAAWQGVRI